LADHSDDGSLTRRRFMRAVVGAGVVAVGAAGGVLARARRERDEPARVTLPVPASDGVVFHRDVILVKSGATLTALAARCPHLGCRIGRVAGDELVCPCHGSRFNLAGKLVTGPAAKDLPVLAVEPAHEQGKVDVVVRR
jgi:nitrite reductase/ring-hydroxylating ferredoxin subunit